MKYPHCTRCRRRRDRSTGLHPAVWLLVLLSATAGPAETLAQGPAFDAALRKSLVVSISGELRGVEKVGAGIIFGVEDSLMYVATANHVVRERSDAAERVRVELHFHPDALRAELLDNSDADMDLAVLQVDLRGANLPLERVSFGLLGYPDSLEPATGLYAVGHPEGERWSINFDPHPFERPDGSDLIFQTTAIAGGHSGGGLFDEEGRLVGMIKSRTTTQARATSIARVLEKLVEWRYPVSLEGRQLPDRWVEEEVQHVVKSALSVVGDAIRQREWSNVPEALAQVYEPYFGADFFSFFRYDRVEHTIEDLEWHSARSAISGTVKTTFYCRQSGRPRPVAYEGLPSARWTWTVDGRTLELADVQPLDDTP